MQDIADRRGGELRRYKTQRRQRSRPPRHRTGDELRRRKYPDGSRRPTNRERSETNRQQDDPRPDPLGGCFLERPPTGRGQDNTDLSARAWGSAQGDPQGVHPRPHGSAPAPGLNGPGSTFIYTRPNLREGGTPRGPAPYTAICGDLVQIGIFYRATRKTPAGGHERSAAAIFTEYAAAQQAKREQRARPGR